MAEKLKSVLQKLWQAQRSRLSLFLKSAIFGLALAFASFSFNWAGILFFAAISILLYERPIFSPSPTRWALLVLLPTAVLGTQILKGSSLPPLLASLAFGGGIFLYSSLFYLLTGIKRHFFVKRSRLYYIAALAIFYSIFIEFFLADKSEWFLLKYGAAVLAAFLIFREWLKMISVFSFPKRELLAAAVFAFLVAQLLWAVALLPIGFISSANLMLLAVFVMADFLLKHFTGGISKEFIIQHLIFFLALSALVFWSSI